MSFISHLHRSAEHLFEYFIQFLAVASKSEKTEETLSLEHASQSEVEALNVLQWLLDCSIISSRVKILEYIFQCVLQFESLHSKQVSSRNVG